MKKVILVLAFLGVILVGCGQKNSSINASKTTSESSINKSSSSNEKGKNFSNNTESTSNTLSKTKNEVNDNASSTKQEISKDTTDMSSISQTDSKGNSSAQQEVNNPLAGYSEDQIEFARVWLAIMGTAYKQDLSNPNTGFELHVKKESAGRPVNPYAQDSVTFPKDTVMLSGKYGYQSLIVYSSNHDGTITQYPVPSHFQNPEENTREGSQKILDSAKIVSIPTNNPEDIKELINIMHIDN